MDVRLRELRHFVAVAEHRHFARATEALFVSQRPLASAPSSSWGSARGWVVDCCRRSGPASPSAPRRPTCACGRSPGTTPPGGWPPRARDGSTLHVTLDGTTSDLARGDVVLVPADSELRVDAGPDGATAWVTTVPGLEAVTADGTRIAPPWER